MAAPIPREHVVKVHAELDNAVIVRPGDKLVVGFAGHVDMATAQEIKQRIADSLPGVEAVLIDRCSSLAVYRDEPGGIPRAADVLAREQLQELRDHALKTDAERRKQARIDGTSPTS